MLGYYHLAQDAHRARCAEQRARRQLAQAIAELVAPGWPYAAAPALIAQWLEEQNLARATPEALALNWLHLNGYIDHGAP